jgi:hypothetical protein
MAIWGCAGGRAGTAGLPSPPARPFRLPPPCPSRPSRPAPPRPTCSHQPTAGARGHGSAAAAVHRGGGAVAGGAQGPGGMHGHEGSRERGRDGGWVATPLPRASVPHLLGFLPLLASPDRPCQTRHPVWPPRHSASAPVGQARQPRPGRGGRLAAATRGGAGGRAWRGAAGGGRGEGEGGRGRRWVRQAGPGSPSAAKPHWPC